MMNSTKTKEESPTKISRTEEKKELGQLNGRWVGSFDKNLKQFSQVKTFLRLAAYIENVRRLELENSRLEQKVISTTREDTSVKNIYDKELSEVQY